MDNQKKTILIVDDNMVSLEAGKIILSNYYRVFGVQSGEKLFEILLNIKPDLILLDVEMHGMNGYEVIRKLKSSEATSDIPVIFLTSHGDAEYELEGLNLGAIDYFSKPFSAPLLLKRIETHLLMISQTRMLRSINDELRTAKDQAEAANRAKTTFLTHISHEIRTPMNAISGFSELMRVDNLDDVQKGYLRDIRDMSKSLLHIINNILDLSKIEAGKMDILPVHFLLGKTFERLCSAYRILVMEKDLEFRSYLDPELPEVICGDEIRIRQIITNIFGNAVKYTQRGFVELRIKKQVRDGKDWLTVSVEDSGVGIKKEDFDKIFNPFQQVNLEQNRFIQGTGLGLSITLKFAELMGGTIEFESEYGKGSVFTIYLPLVPGESKRVEQDNIIERVLAKENIPVLVIDDNPVNLTVALGFLAAHNIMAETAHSGKEALRLMEEKVRAAQPYDLVFMDHLMPEMDGIETTKRIRAWEKETGLESVPIVALTANAVTGVERIFRRVGMNDFISKPIIADELNRVLGKWLPPGKISVSAVQLSGEAESSDDPLLLELAEIEGFDVKTGLSNTGLNRESYFLALRQFLENCGSFVEELDEALRAESWKDYSITVHGLKSVLAALGAGRLSKWAANLEKASKDGRDFSLAQCREETAPFCKNLIKLRDRLCETSLFVSGETGNKTRPGGDTKRLVEQIKLLRKACQDFSGGDAEKVIAWFKEYDWDSETDAALEKISRFAARYDYKEALDEINQFLKKEGVDE